jgi:thymidylate synthase ThyX
MLMRTTREAHPKMRQVTIPLLAEFKACIPILFEDIEPMARQVDNIAKGR